MEEDLFHPHSWSVARLLGRSPAQSLVVAARAVISFDWNGPLSRLQPGSSSQCGAHRAAFELARFLLLAVHEKGSRNLEPSGMIDAVFRALLLDPRGYQGLCLAMNGDCIDYYPIRCDDPIECRALRQNTTREKYALVFGELRPETMWSDAAMVTAPGDSLVAAPLITHPGSHVFN